jgi:hypothetical protein
MAYERLRSMAAATGATGRDGARAGVASASQRETARLPGWSRFHQNGYEVSSAGDSRFSALHARLADGRTIEEAYQLDVKGYRAHGDDWRLGKGKPPLEPMTHEAIWMAYRGLWEQWARENPSLLEELRARANGRVLTDQFAGTPVSQARALAEILAKVPVVRQADAEAPAPSPAARTTSKGIDFARLNDPQVRAASKVSIAGRSAELNLLAQRERLAARYLDEFTSDRLESRERSLVSRALTAPGGVLSDAQSEWLLDLAKRHGWVDPETVEQRRVVLATRPEDSTGMGVGDRAPPCWLAFDLDRAARRRLELCHALLGGGEFAEVAVAIDLALMSQTLTTGEVEEVEEAEGPAFAQGAILMHVNTSGFWFEREGVMTAHVRHGQFNEFVWTGEPTGFFSDGRCYCGDNTDEVSGLYESEMRARERAGEQPRG